MDRFNKNGSGMQVYLLQFFLFVEFQGSDARKQGPEGILKKLVTEYTEGALRASVICVFKGNNSGTAREPFGQFHGSFNGFRS